MQRAAASTPSSIPQSQPQPADTPPLKRQKLFDVTPSANTMPQNPELIRLALDKEEGSEVRVVEKLAKEAGETMWFLSTVKGEAEQIARGLRVATAGYSDIDQDTRRSTAQGRKAYGNFNTGSEVGFVTVSDTLSRSFVILTAFCNSRSIKMARVTRP